MKVGYAFGTDAEQLDKQVQRLETSGCEKIYREIADGVFAERPKLQ